MKNILNFVVIILISSCSTGKFDPAKLFTLQANEKLTEKELQYRLFYGKLLRPEISGDSLIVPAPKEVPLSLKKYMNDFVNIVNTNLKQMSQTERLSTLQAFSAHSVEFLFLNGFVHLQDSLPVLMIDQKKAISLDILQEYTELKNTIPVLDSVFIFTRNGNSELYCRMTSIFSMPRSLFWSSYYLNRYSVSSYNQLLEAVLKIK